MSRLTLTDVEELARSRSGSNRSAVASKIADAFSAGALGVTESKIAASIFRMLARDVEVAVRKTLAVKLHNCPHLPRDVARTLARDVIEVAEPVLRDSSVLADEDLLDIIHFHSQEHHLAIARRTRVSEPVCDALAGTHEKRVVDALLRNRGAHIGETTFDRIMEDFETDEDIQESLVERPALPPRVVRRLVDIVADHMKTRLAASQDLPPALVETLILETREETVAKLLEPVQRERDVGKIVRDLSRTDRLSAAIVIRALEVGDLDFFEHAIAARAHVPPENARRLLRDGANDAIHALYRQARLPEDQFALNRLRIEAAYGARRTLEKADPLVGDEFSSFYERGWPDAADKA